MQENLFAINAAKYAIDHLLERVDEGVAEFETEGLIKPFAYSASKLIANMSLELTNCMPDPRIDDKFIIEE